MGEWFVRPLIGLALLTAVGDAALAATFVVNDTGDVSDATPGDGVCATAGATCTLRAAAEESSMLSGDDVISVPAGTYIAGTGIDLTGSTAIVGAGAASTIIDGNGSGNRTLSMNGHLTLEHLTVRNGGGVTSSTATISDCVFTDNATGGVGGGLFVATGTIRRSTFTNNTSTLVGGGLAITAGEVRDSTFAGNAVIGGIGAGGDAIAAAGGGTLLVANSTVQGDISTLSFCLPPPTPSCTSGTDITLANVTGETAHAANLGGVDPGVITTRNSILTACPSVGLGLASAGHNLFVSTLPCTVNPLLGDLVSTTLPLHPLASNGGPTETRLPLAASAPIDAGGMDCEATDQRGVPRPIGAGCDIGAVEAGCPNGALDPGEACDDGNTVDGDGCDHNCTVTACGNGIVGPGETCDDGNTTSGDCCDATCQTDAAGIPCAGDANACTDDVCSGTGVCSHPNNTAPCDDANACTTGEACGGGTCTGGTVVHCGDTCLACYPDAGCEPLRDTCIGDGTEASRINIRRTGDTLGDRLSFVWRTSAPVSVLDFLLPTEALPAQRLCVYDGAGNVVLNANPNGTCNGGTCWATAPGGFTYGDPLASPDGLHKILLRAGPPEARSALIKIRGRGANLPFAAPGPLALPVRVRFETSNIVGTFPPTFDSQCFDATFDTRVGSNTTTKFAGKSD